MLQANQALVQSWTSILLALYSAALLAFSRKWLQLTYFKLSLWIANTSPAVVGYLADRFENRRWPLLIGLVALGGATALLCVGTSIALWVVGRLFQGTAAAVVWTVGVALLVDTVGKDGLGQAIGYVSMSLSIGTVAGPLLGGVIYQDGGYYSVFALAFALIGVDIFLRVVLIEKKHAAQWLDNEKSAPSTSSEQEKETSGEPCESSAPNTAQPIEASSLEVPEKPKKARHPLRQVATLLSSPRLIVSLWGYFVVSLVLTSFDSVLPIFVQTTFGWQQTGQGLIFLPIMIPHLIDPITGYMIDRYPKSPRYIVSAAFICALPLATLLRLVKHNSMHDKIVLCALLALIGLCLAICMTPLVAEVFHAVKEKEDESPDSFGRGGAMALAFGLSNMGFAAGSLVGPFFAGYIRQSAGWATMGWTMGLIAGFSAIPVLLFLGGWILRRNPPVATEQPGSD